MEIHPALKADQLQRVLWRGHHYGMPGCAPELVLETFKGLLGDPAPLLTWPHFDDPRSQEGVSRRMPAVMWLTLLRHTPGADKHFVQRALAYAVEHCGVDLNATYDVVEQRGDAVLMHTTPLAWLLYGYTRERLPNLLALLRLGADANAAVDWCIAPRYSPLFVALNFYKELSAAEALVEFGARLDPSTDQGAVAMAMTSHPLEQGKLLRFLATLPRGVLAGLEGTAPPGADMPPLHAVVRDFCYRTGSSRGDVYATSTLLELLHVNLGLSMLSVDVQGRTPLQVAADYLAMPPEFWKLHVHGNVYAGEDLAQTQGARIEIFMHTVLQPLTEAEALARP
jgi:hypothetical protein